MFWGKKSLTELEIVNKCGLHLKSQDCICTRPCFAWGWEQCKVEAAVCQSCACFLLCCMCLRCCYYMSAAKRINKENSSNSSTCVCQAELLSAVAERDTRTHTFRRVWGKSHRWPNACAASDGADAGWPLGSTSAPTVDREGQREDREAEKEADIVFFKLLVGVAHDVRESYLRLERLRENNIGWKLFVCVFLRSLFMRSNSMRSAEISNNSSWEELHITKTWRWSQKADEMQRARFLYSYCREATVWRKWFLNLFIWHSFILFVCSGSWSLASMETRVYMSEIIPNKWLLRQTDDRYAQADK